MTTPLTGREANTLGLYLHDSPFPSFTADGEKWAQEWREAEAERNAPAAVEKEKAELPLDVASHRFAFYPHFGVTP